MTRATVISGLDAAAYRSHALHAPQRIWPEKNCYADLWIELLHAQGMDPHAMLPFVFTIDFERDQWTFFKPPLADLRALYGIDVQELTIWRPLLDHALEHLRAGKLLSVEVDAWWLPDTAGTDYRAAHSKTTIVLNDIDAAARRLGYFHNASYHSLEGEDFAGIFALDAPPELPPYAELIHLDRAAVRDPAMLRAVSQRLFADHLAWLPRENPMARFRERFSVDLRMLQGSGLPAYHKWAFAGLRQLGAASELAASYLRWLLGDGAAVAVKAFEANAALAKALTMKSARAVHSGREPDVTAIFDDLSRNWEIATRAALLLAQDADGRAEEPAITAR